MFQFYSVRLSSFDYFVRKSDFWLIRERIMMASSSNKKRKSKVVFDTEKFVSEEAQIRFHDSVVKRIPIAERGLCITGVNWPSIQNNFRAR